MGGAVDLEGVVVGIRLVCFLLGGNTVLSREIKGKGAGCWLLGLSRNIDFDCRRVLYKIAFKKGGTCGDTLRN